MVTMVITLVACNNPPNPANQAFSNNAPSTQTACITPMPTMNLTTMPTPPTQVSFPSPEASFVYPTPPPTNYPIYTVTPTPTDTPAPPEAKINPDLRKIMNETPNHVDFIAMLAEQPRFYRNTYTMTRAERGEYIQSVIQETVDRTQPAVKTAIVALQQSGDVIQFEAFNGPNAFHVLGTAHAVDALAARPDIGWLQPNYYYSDVTGESSAGTQPPNNPCTTNPANSVEQMPKTATLPDTADAVGWNLTMVNVQAAWSRNISGNGITGST